jgi:glycosyltransferase involved in cell wall biosynthesis
MKIVIDATMLAHGHRAGRRHSKNLIETIVRIDQKNSYDLLYIDRHGQNHRYADLPANGIVNEHIISLPERLVRAAWQNFYLPKAEWHFGEFDIFYATDLFFPPTKNAKVLGSVRGIAYYVIKDKLNHKTISAMNQGLKYTLKHADYLLAVSQKTKQELIEYLGIEEDRIYVVSHGVDPKFKRLKKRELLFDRLSTKLGFRSPYVLYVGTIGHHKNIMGILKAYSICNDHGVDLPLVMAGPEGSAWEEANKWVIKKGLDKSVHFIGPVDQDKNEMTDLYNGASLFVFPSFYEGWTAPPIEAMACGVPVITSDCSSLPETVGDAAIKVNPNNSESIAFEIERVLSDEALRFELIKKGFDHARKHTWEKAANKFIELFDDIYQRGPWIEKRL